MKRLILFVSLIICSVAVFSQQLKVVEPLHKDVTDTKASKFSKKDYSGNTCGLILLGMVIPDAKFEGDTIYTEYKDGEWWIYMSPGANWLTIKTPNYTPLRLEFGESIESSVTYIMTIEKNDKSHSKEKTLFAMADVLYSFDTKMPMYGATIGYVYKSVGLYAGIISNFDFEEYTFDKGNNELFYTGKTSQTWFASNVGIMFGKKNFYWKIGAEINYILDFWQLTDESWIRSKNYMFVDMTTGFNFIINRFVLSIDAIIPMEFDKRYWGIKLGAGFKF